MNFDYKIKQMEIEIKKLRKDFKNAKVFTGKLLAIAKKHGATAVGINKQDDTVITDAWTSAPNSLFCKQKNKHYNYPLIWDVAKEAGVHSGCGNSDQVQANTAELIDGIYHLEKGRWIIK